MMDDSRTISRNALFTSITAGLFSLFFLAAISTIPIQEVDAQAKNCAQVDASSYGECDIDRDISEEGFRDCINNVNCFATQTVSVTNTLTSNENADIDINLEQLLNCENDCFTGTPSPGTAAATNRATQNVGVTSAGSSTVDFEVDYDMSQKSDGAGQNTYRANNVGNQQFLIAASNNAFVDADGDDNDVEFVMDQFNDECDSSVCQNDAEQIYNLIASGTSRIDVSSDTGFRANQLNDGCDDVDGFTFDVECNNISDQTLGISTSQSARVTYDTLGLSTTEQTNGCEFGANTNDCTNRATSTASIRASDVSRVTMDDIEQDVFQNLDCDNGENTACNNIATLNLGVVAALDGRVNVDEGSQVAQQSSECDTGSNCNNTADMFVGLGVDNIGIIPVTGTLDAEYEQLVTQTSTCSDNANCNHGATMWYFANARDGAIVFSESNQEIIQTHNCQDANCVTSAFMLNNVFGQNSAQIDAESTQSLEQSCSISSGACNRDNRVITNGQAINNAILNYQTSQNIDNPPDGNGQARIDITRTSGTSNVGPISQTSNGNIVG